jgi:hypothetical protein
MQTQPPKTANVTFSPEIQNEAKNAVTTVDKAKVLEISNPTDYVLAEQLLKAVKGHIVSLETQRKLMTGPLDASKRAILDFFRPPMEKLETAKAHLNGIMINWVSDIKRKEDELRRQMEAEAKKQSEEAQLEAAIEAEAAGEPEQAEAILKEKPYVPTVKIVSEVPKIKGAYVRETWSAEGFDLMLTVKAIVEGRAPIQAVKYDETWLNSQARAYKEKLKIPGVKPVSKETQV